MKEIAFEIEKRDSAPLPCNEGTAMRVVSCRPYNRTGVIEYVEIISKTPIGEALDKLVNDPNVAYTTFHIFDESRASGIIATKKSPICRLISSAGGFCKTCQQEYGSCKSDRFRWRVVLPDGAAANSFLQKLKGNGVDEQTTDVGDLKENGLLTLREEEAVRLAESEGYFHFPRKTSLRELSKKLSISPSTLDEILRRAQSKIVKGHIKKPNAATPEKNHDAIVKLIDS